MAVGSSRLLFYFSLFVIEALVLTIAQPTPLAHICSDKGNFTTTSAYKSNLDHLLNSLSSNTEIDYGFYSNSYGKSTDKVYAIALCRGDKKPDTCRSCINNSTQVLTQSCPKEKEAINWYDDCMLRYSNRSISGTMEFEPSFLMYNMNNVSEVNQFRKALKTLLDSVTSHAASGDSHKKFATGNVTTANNQTIYALVQCTPDLSKMQCSDCLTSAAGSIAQCCSASQGGRVISPSCILRYEEYLFYDAAAEALPPSPVPQPVLPPAPLGTPVGPQANSTPSATGKACKIAPSVIAVVLPALLL